MSLAPLPSAEFARLMAGLGPFEARPRIAVAVSGGADSMALALLAQAWAVKRGGEAVALTVDHGLRPDSAEEAARVSDWLAARGMAHHILPWTGPKPAADLQAAARAARYALLEGWCRAEGVLHLLLAHHQDDQAETVLLRLGRGSGVDGLSAMAPVQEGPFLRLLRPLLAVPPGRLRATLGALGQDWVEDPSNRNSAFARARLRQLMPALAAEGLTAERLAATASRLARARAALDGAVAEAAARFVVMEPAGFALVEPGCFARLPEEVASRLMVRLLLAVGGGAYPPRRERSAALLAALRGGEAVDRTLAGCRLTPWRGRLVVCREAARAQPPLALAPREEVVWDGRFRLRLAEDAPPGLSVGALGLQGWRRVADLCKGRTLPAIPPVARAALPAIYDELGISAVPHLGYNREGGRAEAFRSMVVTPSNPLTVVGHCLV